MVLISLLLSCGRANTKLETLDLKLNDSNYTIVNDTIYKDKHAIAVKVSAIKRHDDSRVLIVKSIK